MATPTTFARSGADIAIPLAIQTDPATVASIQISDALKMGLGEYFADQTQGFPWVQQVLGVKNPVIAAITALIRSAILAIENVATVIDVSVTFSVHTRTFSYTWDAVLADGTTIDGDGAV